MSRIVLGCLVAMIFIVASPSIAEPTSQTYLVDDLGRLHGVTGRTAITCPRQTDRTAVIVIAGQSNSANFGEVKFKSRHAARVVNYFAGRCYRAESPLLGANGMRGESWTLMSDKLIDARTFDQVVLVTTGIGGTGIAQWRQGGDLNQMLVDVVRNLTSRYRVTHVLWHQGERDLRLNTTTDEYTSGLLSVVETLRKSGVDGPIFVSIASKCSELTNEPDPVSDAQRRVVDAAKGIFSGPDTNALLPASDRYDVCHFARSGQEKFAEAWVEILNAHAHVSNR